MTACQRVIGRFCRLKTSFELSRNKIRLRPVAKTTITHPPPPDHQHLCNSFSKALQQRLWLLMAVIVAT